MNSIVEFDSSIYARINEHLFGHNKYVEQAAFVFLEANFDGDFIQFNARDLFLLQDDYLLTQKAYFIEMSDGARQAIIKHAHDNNFCLAEVHSHTDPSAYSFSYSDFLGFQETVPHFWWRLKGKPYIAFVFTECGFDALVWTEDPNRPEKLSRLDVDGSSLFPTNMSIRSFYG